MKPKRFAAGRVQQICAERTVEFNGKTYKPDGFTAYIVFELAHAWPAGVTRDGFATHPQVIANSYNSMRNQVFDIDHAIHAYNPGTHAEDRIIGTVIDVEFPAAPDGGWKVQMDKAKAPAVRGLAVIHKQAKAVKEILYQHLSGNFEWTVSMEREYYPHQSGFLAGPGVRKMLSLPETEFTTPDLRAAGYEYYPYSDQCSARLRPTWDLEKGGLKSDWSGRDLVFLCGGIDGSVQFQGVGIVPFGAEPEAEILQMVASDTPERFAGAILGRLAEILSAFHLETQHIPASSPLYTSVISPARSHTRNRV